jgi:hypothetical protein
MSAISGTASASEITNETEERIPVPVTVPGGFLVHLGEGWGGSLHELADGLAVWIINPEAAVNALLGCFEFIQVEIEGIDESHDLLEGLELLRGAVMAAGIEAVGIGRGGFKSW